MICNEAGNESILLTIPTDSCVKTRVSLMVSLCNLNEKRMEFSYREEEIVKILRSDRVEGFATVDRKQGKLKMLLIVKLSSPFDAAEISERFRTLLSERPDHRTKGVSVNRPAAIITINGKYIEEPMSFIRIPALYYSFE